MGVSGIHRDTIWGYPKYEASNCVRHMVSPGLDGLKGLHTISAILEGLFTFSNSLYLKT